MEKFISLKNRRTGENTTSAYILSGGGANSNFLLQKTKIYLLIVVLALVGAGTVKAETATITIVPDQTITGSTATAYVTTATPFTAQSIGWSINNWNPKTLQVRGNQSAISSNFQFYNTTAIQGNITKITLNSAVPVDGTASNRLNSSKITLVVGSSAQSGTTTGTTGTAGTNLIYWQPSTSNTFFRIQFENGATTGTAIIASMVIEYDVTPPTTPSISTVPSMLSFTKNLISGAATGDGVVTVTGLNLTESITPTIEQDVTGFSIDASSSLDATGGTVKINFNPTLPGPYTALLKLEADGATATVNLSGIASATANPPAFSPAPEECFYSAQYITITSSESTIYYTIDGSDPATSATRIAYIAPFPLSTTTTVRAKSYNATYNVYSINVEQTYTFPIEVATIAALRAGERNKIYKLTGEALVTMVASDGDANFVQDNTGSGIVFYDTDDVITNNYSVGDILQNVYGKLIDYYGMLELELTQDPGTPVSTDNTVTPDVVTLDDLENYPSRLVKLENVVIDETGNFAQSTNYTLTQDGETGILRPMYSDLDYIGTLIPNTSYNITGVVSRYHVGETLQYRLVPRSLADFERAALPYIGARPDELHFTAEVGATSAVQEVVVTVSDLTDPVSVAFDSYFGNADMFSVVESTLDRDAGGTLHITYHPTAAGSHAARILLTTNGTSAHDTIFLYGTATLQTPIAQAPALNSCSSFTALWGSVPGATGYTLDVYTKSTTTGTGPELVSNGGFDNGDKSSWYGAASSSSTSLNNFAYWNVVSTSPQSGTYSLQRTQSSETARLEQTVTVEIGKSYIFSFYYKYAATNTNGLKNYTINGAGINYIEGGAPAKLSAATEWTKYEKTFTATDATVTISIRSYEPCEIDNISLVEKDAEIIVHTSISGYPANEIAFQKTLTDLTAGTEYYYRVQAYDAANNLSAWSNEVQAIPTPDVHTWHGTYGDSWEAEANWGDGNIPTAGCDVIIPDFVVPVYPVLTTDVYCHDITFKAKARIGNQHFLHYNEATVEYGLTPARWYMLATPIEATVSDFHRNFTPRTWLQTFGDDGAQWTYQNDLSKELHIGDGFAFYYNPDPALSDDFAVKGTLLDESLLDESGAFSHSLNFANDGTNDFAIVGNPYITAINFTALNQESSYLIYTGNGYSGYNVLTGAYGVELDPNLDKFIAPLQSFIIERDPDTGTTFEFTPAAQVTNGTYGTGNLRSIDTSDLLRITASNPSASVSTVVAQRTAGVSSHKLFDDLSATPDVYTLQGNQRFGVQLLTDNDVLLPLGLRTNYTGAMSLTFSGMDSYNARISFTDAATGVVRDLTDLDSFTYDFEYAPAADNEESRFYIQLSPKTPTGIGTAIDRVVSTEYYTLQGVRYSGSPSNGISDGTPYIVKQIYQSGKSVAKVIINK